MISGVRDGPLRRFIKKLALLRYTALPEFLPECGYQAIYKKAEGLRKSLERANLPPEKLQELLKKLHLEDKE